MDTAKLIRRLKRSIGIYGIALPIDNLDKLILEIIDDTTLPVFSIYSPQEVKVAINTTDFVTTNNARGEGCMLYLLPEYLFKGDKEVLYVMNVEYNESYLRPHYFPTVGNTMSSFSAIENAMLSTAEKSMLDQFVKPITWTYEHPRKLYIYDSLMSAALLLTLGVTHDSSLQSIPPTAFESFFTLASLDVKAGLYNTVKHYDGMETQYGRIELKIDDWTNAKQERDDLLKEWDETYLNDQYQMIYG